MITSAISNQRLFNQHVHGTNFHSPKELVRWMGVVQAQDYTMSKYAIGVRLKNATDQIVEDAINKGEIIRTHVLRPTWHLVAAKDVRWMLELTAKNINRIMASNNKRLALDEKTFKKCNAIIEKLLRDGKQLTRKEIMSALEKKGISTNELRASHIMLRAETDLVVCNGVKKDKQLTYALLDERAPLSKTLTKEEALAELAGRYFRSHGPATLQDFTWWSGLSVSDAKNGLALIRGKLSFIKRKETIFWFDERTNSTGKKRESLIFLPAFDEFLISYKSRAISLDTQFASHAFTMNGIFNPIIVHNAKVIGTWKPRYKKEIVVETRFFSIPNGKEKGLCEKAVQRFGRFLNQQVTMI